MNLRDLQYLVAVAEQLHFGKAALACHVSQPTLSMQLKKLEETLGVQLFERTNKRVMLTPMGYDVTAIARRILADAEQVHRITKAANNPLAGDLRLGVFPTLAPYLLPSLMPLLKGAFASLNILLVEEKTHELIRQLESGEIDAAMLAMPVHSSVLTSAMLFTEPFMVAVATSHPLAKRTSVSLGDLSKESMLLLEDGHCLRAQALEVCEMIGVGETNNFRATSLETLRHMVAAGDSVTLMPKLAINVHDPLLRYIPFKKPAPSRSIGLYWRKTSARVALFQKITALASESYKEI